MGQSDVYRRSYRRTHRQRRATRTQAGVLNDTRWLGLAFVIGGALLLSLKGIMAKFMYAAGMNFETVTGIRAILAVPGFWLWGIWRLGAKPLLQVNRRAMFAAGLAGFLGYYIGAMVDFYALTLIDASLERVLLFSYPALIVMVRAMQTRAWPSARMLTALGAAYLGIFLAVGGFDPALLMQNIYGAGLVMVCACTLTWYFLANEKIGKQIGSVAFTVYAMTAAAMGLAAHLLFATEASEFVLSTRAWQLMAFTVLFVTVAPLFMMAEGVRLIGAQRAAIASTAGPPSTIIFAWWLLDERLLPLQLAGAVLIIAAIVFLERKPKEQAQETP